MTFHSSRFHALTSTLTDFYEDPSLLDLDFDPVIDDLEREFAELLCLMPR